MLPLGLVVGVTYVINEYHVLMADGVQIAFSYAKEDALLWRCKGRNGELVARELEDYLLFSEEPFLQGKVGVFFKVNLLRVSDGLKS